MIPTTKEGFSAFVEEFYDGVPSNRQPILSGVGGLMKTRNGTLASVHYPTVNGIRSKARGTAAVLMTVFGIKPEGVQNVVATRGKIAEAYEYLKMFDGDGDPHPNIEVLKAAFVPSSKGDVVVSMIFDDIAPKGVLDATLKLYGLSNLLFKPGELNLDGIFGCLPDVAWVGGRPMDSGEVSDALMAAAFGGASYSPALFDRFPLYTDRMNAEKMGVRIMDPNKVRLGAYLGRGTTIMPGASYVNFNAGTEGKCMVEGRISSSAFIGWGTDVGGGASILGVLSGGNKDPIRVGRNCLLGANSTLGISIGDCVILSAGTAVMAGSKVRVNLFGHPLDGQTVKAAQLSTIDDVTFRRNDGSGRLELVRMPQNIERSQMLARNEATLNAALHVD